MKITGLLLSISFSFYLLTTSPSAGQAFDLSNILKTKPELSDQRLTAMCKAEPATAITICEGNEGRIHFVSASLETKGNIFLTAVFRQTNKHIPWKGFTAYNSSSNVNLSIEVNSSCQIVSKKITGENTYVQIANAILSTLGQNLADVAIKDKAIPGC